MRWGPFLIIVASMLTPGSAVAETCLEKSLAKTLEDYPVLDVSDQVKSRSGYVPLKELFGDKPVVALGFSGGHAYLLVDGVRFDGGVLGLPGRVRKGITTVSEGILIQFTDMPAEVAASLKERLLTKKPTWALNCINDVCKILNDGGVTIAGQPKLPASIFKDMFTKGFLGPKGKPLSVEVFRINGLSLGQQFKNVLSLQRMSFATGGLVIVAAVAARQVFIAMVSNSDPQSDQTERP